MLAVAAAAFAAASLRLGSIAAMLVTAYLVLVAHVAMVTWLLSPFDAVTVGWLTLVELALAVTTVVIWLRRGRPLPPTAGASADLRLVRADPLTLGFIAIAAIGLAYELVLALTP